MYDVHELKYGPLGISHIYTASTRSAPISWLHLATRSSYALFWGMSARHRLISNPPIAGGFSTGVRSSEYQNINTV